MPKCVTSPNSWWKREDGRKNRVCHCLFFWKPLNSLVVVGFYCCRFALSLARNLGKMVQLRRQIRLACTIFLREKKIVIEYNWTHLHIIWLHSGTNQKCNFTDLQCGVVEWADAIWPQLQYGTIMVQCVLQILWGGGANKCNISGFSSHMYAHRQQCPLLIGMEHFKVDMAHYPANTPVNRPANRAAQKRTGGKRQSRGIGCKMYCRFGVTRIPVHSCYLHGLT